MMFLAALFLMVGTALAQTKVKEYLAYHLRRYGAN